MLKFLRKIRKSLIESGSAKKYLLYAIGEIVLIVLGILIALQINNWNESRKATKQEIIILKNIKEDINLDTLDLTFNYQYHLKFYEAEKALLIFLMAEQSNGLLADSINFNDALGTTLWTALHRATFTNLQNNDVGLLKNNKIRKSISRFYDFYYQAIENMANRFEEFNLYKSKLPYFKKYFRVSPNLQKLLDIQGQPDYFEHNLFKNEIVLFDMEGAKSDHEFIFTLNEVLFFRKAFVDFHEAVLAEIELLNALIGEEIEKLEKSL